MQTGATVTHAVEVPAAGAYRINVRYDGADIRLSVNGSGESRSWQADIPGAAIGEEYVVVDSTAAEQLSVAVINTGGDNKDYYELSISKVPKQLEVATRLSSTATSMIGPLDARIIAHQQAIELWQKLDDSVEAARLQSSMAAIYRDDGSLLKAIEAFQHAGESFRRAGETRRALWSEYGAAEIFVWQGSIGEARKKFKAIESESREVGDPELIGASRNYVALTYLIQGELLEARSRFHQLEPYLKNEDLTHQLATVLHNLGGSYYEGGEYLPALSYFQQAIELDRALDPAAEIFETLEEIGGIYTRMGDCDRAFQVLNEAMEGARKKSQSPLGDVADRRAEGRILDRMGQCFLELGDLGGAIEYFEQALALREASGDQRGIAYTRGNIAEARLLRGEADEPMVLLTQAVESHRARNDNLGLVDALLSMAKISASVGDTDQAMNWARDALARSVANGYSGKVARANLVIGNLLAIGDDPRSAMAFYDRAIRHFESAGMTIDEMEALAAKAALFQALDDLSSAASVVDSAISRAENFRLGVGSAALRSTFMATVQSVYLLGIKQQLANTDYKNDTSALIRALEINDARRSRVFREQRDALVRLENSADTPSTSRLKQLRMTLNGKLVRLGEASARGQEKAISTLKSDIAELRIELLAAEADALDDPSSRTANRRLLDENLLAEIRSSLAANEIIMDFAQDPSEIFVWVIANESLRLIGLPLPKGEHENLQQLEKVVAEMFQDIANDYPQVDRVTIVPDGDVSRLSLAGLPNISGGYLIDRFALTYSPAVALVESSVGEFDAGESVSLVADPILPSYRKVQDDRLATHTTLASRNFNIFEVDQLPYARQEVQKVADLAGSRNITMLVGSVATKERVLQEMFAGNDVLHFATHGYSDSSLPELSGIVLSGANDQAGVADRYLNLHDIYENGPIDATLVVLSACRTGRGRYVRGEGAESLARAFLQGGARYVVASRWDVADRATAELMVLFYDGLFRRNLNPALALARAQRSIRATRQWQDPKFWSGFDVWSASSDSGPHPTM